ncbi:hypothetical protein CLOM_g539 [Closterium sp. NIES-68]|nr:hypothetical protein CLOM_g539 [Closterium sp. NIES-68]
MPTCAATSLVGPPALWIAPLSPPQALPRVPTPMASHMLLISFIRSASPIGCHCSRTSCRPPSHAAPYLLKQRSEWERATWQASLCSTRVETWGPLLWAVGQAYQAQSTSISAPPAPIMTAGGNYKWALNTLLNIADVSEAAFHAADVAALSVPAGSGGLLYLPFLNGERCPFEDPNMRAAFIGVSAATTQSHMIRAVLEGVAFALLSAYGAMHTCSSGSRSTGDTAPLRIVGGGARYVGLISVGANHGICVQPTNRLPR